MDLVGLAAEPAAEAEAGGEWGGVARCLLLFDDDDDDVADLGGCRELVGCSPRSDESADDAAIEDDSHSAAEALPSAPAGSAAEQTSKKMTLLGRSLLPIIGWLALVAPQWRPPVAILKTLVTEPRLVAEAAAAAVSLLWPALCCWSAAAAAATLVVGQAAPAASSRDCDGDTFPEGCRWTLEAPAAAAAAAAAAPAPVGQ